MFTGIIQDIGTVVDIIKKNDWLLTIESKKLSLSSMQVGSSIACSGICLTLIKFMDHRFEVQVSAETLAKTTINQWQTGRRINLEPALRLGDEWGGHFVTGHVDGTSILLAKKNENDSLRLEFQPPRDFMRYMAAKGSVCLDGVSLTINETGSNSFGVNIIPHTQAATTLGSLSPNTEVNFEVDVIARYSEQLLSSKQNS